MCFCPAAPRPSAAKPQGDAVVNFRCLLAYQWYTLARKPCPRCGKPWRGWLQRAMNLVAKNWWRDDHFRSLPGEESQTTLFVVEFQDGCRHFGYTRGSVFGRLSELIGGSFQ